MTSTNPTRVTAAHLRLAFKDNPFTIAEAEAVGVTPARLRQAFRCGLVCRVRRGWYAAPDMRDLDPSAAQRPGGAACPISPDALAVVRALEDRGAHPVIAGSLAARWWGLDLLADRFGEAPPAVILVNRHSAVRRGQRGGVLIRHADLDEIDIVRDPDGRAFTSALRTGVDCARGQDEINAFIVINSAVRRSLDVRAPQKPGLRADARRLTDLAAQPASAAHALQNLRSVVERTSGCGISVVHGVLHLIDPRLESALESLSWWRFHEFGLVIPTPQQWIRGASGRRYRVDFDFGGVVGECDGLVKYTQASDLRSEKERQMDIELGGRPVVRWGWQHMWHHPERVMSAVHIARGA